MADTLEKLIEKVEAESAHFTDFSGALEKPLDRYAYQADAGSLDAAKALHEALLPGWTWGKYAHVDVVYVQPDPDDPNIDPEDFEHEGRCEGPPSRAWLLAILKAKLAEVGDE